MTTGLQHVMVKATRSPASVSAAGSQMYGAAAPVHDALQEQQATVDAAEEATRAYQAQIARLHQEYQARHTERAPAIAQVAPCALIHVHVLFPGGQSGTPGTHLPPWFEW